MKVWFILPVVAFSMMRGNPVQANGITCGLRMIFRPESEPLVIEPLPLPPDHEVKPGDPYDPVGLMPVGSHRGVPIDTHRKRPSKIIYEDDHEILVANFRHDNEFHQAHISKQGVQDVYFRINRFPGPAGMTPAHTLFYFRMKPGSEVLLEGVRNIPDLSNPTRVSDFVVSADYAAPRGVMYELLKSMQPEYMSVIDLSSSTDYAARGEDPNFALQYVKFTVSDDVKNRVLSSAIHMSDKRGLSYVYNLMNLNCTTEAFRILDDSIVYPKPVKRFKQSIFSLKDPVAGPSIKALFERGVIHKSEDGSIPSIWVPYGHSLP